MRACFAWSWQTQDYVKLVADAMSRLSEENQGEIQPQGCVARRHFRLGLQVSYGIFGRQPGELEEACN